MRKTLPETDQAIKKLLAAGLARKDFTVKSFKRSSSWRTIKGKMYREEHMETQIRIKNVEAASRVIKAIAAQDFYVERLWWRAGEDDEWKIAGINVKDDRKHRGWIREVNREEETEWIQKEL